MRLRIHIRCFPKGQNKLGWFLPENKESTLKLKTIHGFNKNLNPFGSRGKAFHGYKKMSKPKRPRTKIEEQIVRDAREIKELAAMHAPAAIKVIAEIMKDKKTLDAVRIAAANALIDRGYGKATQMNITATVNADGKPSEIDDKELTTRINSAIERVERITGRAKQPAPRQERPADLRKLN